MDDAPVCIFDSGSGGLSVWQEIRRQLPLEPTVYLGDHQEVPYGGRTREFIINRVLKVLRAGMFLRPKLIVIACNTATTAGIIRFRRAFWEVPVIGVVPVVKKAAEITKTGHLAVFSTDFTARSGYQKRLIRQFTAGKKVTVLSSGTLVGLLENGKAGSKETDRELKRSLLPVVGTDCDTLALGCTHFPFIAPLIRDIVGPKVTLLEPSGAVARQTARVLGLEGKLAKGVGGRTTHRFLTTGEPTAVSRRVFLLTGIREVFSNLPVT